MRRLSDAALDAARRRGDPPADAFVAGRAAQSLSPELPPFYDPVRALRAQRFVQAHLLHATTALFYASLPTSYAAARGAAVLAATGRMAADLDRRVNETARFFLDLVAPHALEPGGHALVHVACVRLIHARVRRELRPHQPEAEVPINQEDLLGTLLVFSVVVVRALRRLGVRMSDADADDYYQLWRVYGALLGIEAELIPENYTAAEALSERIAQRQLAPSPHGRLLMQVLSERIAAHVPFPGAVSYLVRRLAGDHVADVLGVPSDREFCGVLLRLSSVPMLRDIAMGRLLLGMPPLFARSLLDAIVTHKLRQNVKSTYCGT